MKIVLKISCALFLGLTLYAETQTTDYMDYISSEQEVVGPVCPKRTGYTVNFENISVIQLVQFISRISGTNFVFDGNDLQFNVTIVSEEETSVEDLMASLLQILKMHGLSVVELGNNVLISRDQKISKVSTVVTDENMSDQCDASIVTRVFRLYNVDPEKIQNLVRPLLSADAIVEVSVETRHLIIADIRSNVDKIAELLIAIDTANAAFEISEYDVINADVTVLAEYLREIILPLSKDQPMQIVSQNGAKKIFIISSPYLNNKALQVLRALDIPDVTKMADLSAQSISNNELHMYKLKYQKGQDVADALHDIGSNLRNTGSLNMDLVNTIYSIKWLDVNNSIIITGTEATVEKVKQLLDDLDRPPKQVYIEVLILDTSLSNSLDFGVQWIALGDEQNKLAYASGLLSDSPISPNIQGTTSTNPGARYVASNPTNSPPTVPNAGRDVPLPTPSTLAGISGLAGGSSAFGLGIVGNILRHNGQSFLTLGALVSALDQEQDTKIVLNPRVMVEDTKTATFFVGSNIPYQTTNSIVNLAGTNTQNFQYEDIGVQLQVTPNIAPNNVVTLQINQSISDVLQAMTSNNLLAPTTSKILSTTRVHVPDNCFLVMSGHIRDFVSNVQSGIPCLGTLPLVGPLFSRNIEQRQKRNLILFLRPKVITSIGDGVDLTNQEGYDYNYESHPCSISECGVPQAPENETCSEVDDSVQNSMVNKKILEVKQK